MTVRGRVKNGVVVLSKSAKLPEGAAVEVHLLAKSRKKPKASKTRRSLADRGERVAPARGERESTSCRERDSTACGGWDSGCER